MYNKFVYSNTVIKKISISQIRTTTRRLASTRSLSKLSNMVPTETVIGRVELDSHADTTVFGRNFVVMSYSGKECDVMPYSDNYEAVKDIPIVTAATAWTDKETAQTYILVFNEGLLMPETMQDTLLNPNQVRAFGGFVQDNPYSGEPIYTADPTEEVTIPLASEGVILYFESRTPTEHELHNCPHIQMTSEREWIPRAVKLPGPAVSMEEHRLARNISSLETKSSYGTGWEEWDDGMGEESTVNIYNIDDFNERICSSCSVRTVRSVSAVMPTDVPTPNTFVSGDRKSDVSYQSLAEKWHIGFETAKKTLKSTTQRLIRSAVLPLSRRYKADRMFRLPQLQGEFFTDTVFEKVKSKDGNTCGQIFANELYFCTFYPMSSKAKAGEALSEFCKEFGIPEKLRTDQAPEMCGFKTEFQKCVRKYGISHHKAEAGMHNQSPAEGVVRECRRKWYRIMFAKKVPIFLWDYGLRWVCEIMSRTHSRSHRLDGGCVPLQGLTGETVDISDYLDFGFYDRVWYRDNAGMGPVLMGRWLGKSHSVGSVMCFWVLGPTGQVTARSSVSKVTNLELETDLVKEQATAFDQMVTALHGNLMPAQGDKPDPELWADYVENDEDFREEFFKVYSSEEVQEADDEYSPEYLDNEIISMELALPRGTDEMERARVKKRMRDEDGNPIGVQNDNPILDTRMFEVEFQDGTTAAMSANAISENLFAQVDSEGNRHILIDSVIGHRTTGQELSGDDAFITTKSGQKRRKPTTKGWEILVRWKDCAETWTPLKDMKDSFPIQMAEYAVMHKLESQPAFAWWIDQVLRKRERIISKVKTKYWERTHKFGIEVPKTVAQAIAIDKRNGNTLWQDGIAKEMKTLVNAQTFEEILNGIKPTGYTEIPCHWIFDVKLGENYRRKARFVAGGHKTDAPASITYSSVVSRDSVRIAFLLAALNDVKILACDIHGAYLTAPCREKIVFRAGQEFGADAGKLMKITKALYGLKSSGASFRAFLAEHLHAIGYRSSLADPDVWLRPAVKPDGEEYYEMVLTYVDDILCVSAKPEGTMKQIQAKFKLKNDAYLPPTDYLGAGIGRMTTANGTECWTQSADKYLAESVKNVEATLAKHGNKLSGNFVSPTSNGYKPEEDTTAELGKEGVSYYQELIGVLRWGVELGRIDILHEVSVLSQHLALPREGHLEQALHIFGFLKTHPKRKIAFDPDHPKIDPSRFKKYNWEDFYRDAVEAIPPNAPKARGKHVSTHCFVDANLAGDTATRRSQTGILIFVNRAPIHWYSKRQSTVETSTFGSEIVAMKTAIEMIKALRYKLRMFGVEIEGPTGVYCDNEAVTKNCSIPESVLRKKHHSIAYHHNRQAVASGTVQITKEHTSTNLADLFTKNLGRVERDSKLNRFMY